jgi:hypothetical protein
MTYSIPAPAVGQYQPYFVAYARTQELAPGDVVARDGSMAPYVVWIHQQWRAWATETGRSLDGLSDGDRAAFLSWLDAKTATKSPEFPAQSPDEIPVGLGENGGES